LLYGKFTDENNNLLKIVDLMSICYVCIR